MYDGNFGASILMFIICVVVVGMAAGSFLTYSIMKNNKEHVFYSVIPPHPGAETTQVNTLDDKCGYTALLNKERTKVIYMVVNRGEGCQKIIEVE